MTRRWLGSLGAVLLCAGSAGGCGPIASELEGRDGGPGGGGPVGDGGVPLPEDDGTTFIPFQRDFQGFSSWTHFEITDAPQVGDGTIHAKGKRVVYVNQLPPSGRRSFPVGTIIVKTIETGETFARVKRGGTYNRSGAVGWEWFELKQSGEEWLILWRGITPPAGFCYGGIAGGACNGCHGPFSENDFVATPALNLAAF